MLPNFLVIGAPRAGTTWIHANLMAHPGVYVPHEKEIHFFDRQYAKGLEYYESFFSGWGGEKAIGETTPSYLHRAFVSDDVPRLIRRHLPDVRLVASLRNPVDRVYSRYWHSKARFARNASLTFEQKISSRPTFINEGFYASHLSRYYDYFPKEQVLVLLFDDPLNDPVEFMRRIYQFIGVEPTFDAGLGSLQVNASSGKQRLARSRLAWLIGNSLNRIGFIATAEAIRKRNSVETPPMSDATRRWLVNTYREENRRLGMLIGRNLEFWNE